MPPQNAVELVSKSGSETPKNGNLNNNNNKDNIIAELEPMGNLSKKDPSLPIRTTIIIPPDGGFGWIVMVSYFIICVNLIPYWRHKIFIKFH